MEDFEWFVAFVGVWVMYFVSVSASIYFDLWILTIIPMIMLSVMAFLTLDILSKWRRTARHGNSVLQKIKI